MKRVRTAALRETVSTVSLFHSRGFAATRRESLCSAHVETVAEDQGEGQTGYGFRVARSLRELDAAAIAGEGANRALRMFGAVRPESGRCRAVLENGAAAELLEQDWGVAADVWSATSFTELRRDGLAAERWNLLHPEDRPRVPYVTQCLDKRAGPVVAASDYIKTFADQIRPFIPAGRPYRVLGTDGFGRSDSRAKLRYFFEVNRHFVAVAALKALAESGDGKAKTVSEAIKKYKLDPDKPDPTTV